LRRRCQSLSLVNILSGQQITHFASYKPLTPGGDQPRHSWQSCRWPGQRIHRHPHTK